MIESLTAGAKTVLSTAVRALLTGLTFPFLILLRWLCNLALVWLLLHPLFQLSGDFLDRSNLRETFADAIPLTVLTEFKWVYPGLLDGAVSNLIPLMVLFVLLGIFLNGGIFHAFWSRGGGPSTFFGACGRNFPSMMGTLLLTALAFCLTIWLPILLLAHGVDLFYERVSQSQRWIYLLWWGGLVLIGGMMLSALVRVYDFARLLTCEPDKPHTPLRVFGDFWRAVVLTRRHHVTTFVLLVFFTALHPVLYWVHAQLGAYLPQSNAHLWTLGLGQLLVIARIYLGFARLNGQLTFLKEHRNQVVVPKKESEKEAMIDQAEHDMFDEFPHEEAEPANRTEEPDEPRIDWGQSPDETTTAEPAASSDMFDVAPLEQPANPVSNLGAGSEEGPGKEPEQK